MFALPEDPAPMGVGRRQFPEAVGKLGEGCFVRHPLTFPLLLSWS
jgi:hypothetical protein